MNEKYPILEFDPDQSAIIDPKKEVRATDVPEHFILCFFQKVIYRLKRQKRLKKIAEHKSAMGVHPLYQFEHLGQRLALFHPGIGAPLAAGFLEEMIARGCKKFIVCGGCGVLDSEIAMRQVLNPTVAVRDEGTSYHYLPPGREIEADPVAIQAITTVLERLAVPFLKVKTWSTDGFYRETRGKIARRKAEGCLAVEMEAAAFFAVAKFRQVNLGLILFAGDSVAGEQWDPRRWTKSIDLPEQIFWLSVEACLAIK